MKCASALSTSRNTDQAFQDVLGRLAEGLGGAPADLAVAFSSMHHADALDRLAAEVRGRGLGRHVLGCTGESIVGEDREVEGSAALSLWAIRLSGVALRPLRLTFEEDGFGGWPADLDPAAARGRTLILLADPFTFPADEWLKQLAAEGEGPSVAGGMASGSQVPGQNRLLLDEQVFDRGAVAVLLDDAIPIRTVVSQGCRPIGRPMVVTKAEGNVIRDLGRRPALDVLREQFSELDPADQARVQEGLHLGRVINEYQETFKRGDFLIRNVLGADESGGVAITDVVRVGQTVQFHVRDAETADQDLREMLGGDRADAPPAGALLFTCNGRGTRLFEQPDHDVGVLRELLGPIPIAGFFAMGEFGPVGGRNFVHGYTASVVVFPEGGP